MQELQRACRLLLPPPPQHGSLLLAGTSQQLLSTWIEHLPTKLQGAVKRFNRQSLPPARLQLGEVSPLRAVPGHISQPSYVGKIYRAGPGISSLPEIQHTEQDRVGMRAAGQLAAKALQLAGRMVQPGVTTDALDAAVHDFCIQNGAYPSPLLYHGFPKSICCSVNEVVCHGIPDSRPLQDGDIVNVDVTVFLDGYHGDTNATFLCGEPPPAARELVEVTRSCLDAAVQLCGPDVPFSAIGHCIQQLADAEGCSIVHYFVGHGIGKVFHAAPAVLHHRNWRQGRMKLHQTFTIEPILTLGTRRHRVLPDGWTAVTKDGSYAAQFEHTLMITEPGAELLTQLPATAPNKEKMTQES